MPTPGIQFSFHVNGTTEQDIHSARHVFSALGFLLAQDPLIRTTFSGLTEQHPLFRSGFLGDYDDPAHVHVRQVLETLVVSKLGPEYAIMAACLYVNFLAYVMATIAGRPARIDWDAKPVPELARDFPPLPDETMEDQYARFIRTRPPALPRGRRPRNNGAHLAHHAEWFYRLKWVREASQRQFTRHYSEHRALSKKTDARKHIREHVAEVGALLRLITPPVRILLPLPA